MKMDYFCWMNDFSLAKCCWWCFGVGAHDDNDGDPYRIGWALRWILSSEANEWQRNKL